MPKNRLPTAPELHPIVLPCSGNQDRQVLTLQNEGHQSMQVLLEGEDHSLRLPPGAQIEVELGQGAVRLYFFDNGLQIASAEGGRPRPCDVAH